MLFLLLFISVERDAVENRGNGQKLNLSLPSFLLSIISFNFIKAGRFSRDFITDLDVGGEFISLWDGRLSDAR